MPPTSTTIDLGLAISGALCRPGQTRTASEIARFCGCTKEAIEFIERRAIFKIRRRLTYGPLIGHLSPHDIPDPPAANTDGPGLPNPIYRPE